MGSSALAVSGAPSLAPDDEEVLSEIRRLFKRKDYHPPKPPSAALEVRSAAEREDATIEDVVQLLERDALLAAETLRLAQSPSFASRIAPRTIHEAVMRLGLRTLVNVVWQAALAAGVFKAKGYEEAMESLRRHSTATAALARFVLQKAGRGAKSERAFLVALLHDVGVAALLVALADGELEAGSLEEAVPMIEVAHEEAGLLLTRLWKLPVDLQLALSQHHGVEGDHGGEVDEVQQALDVAQHLAAAHGCSLVLAGRTLDTVPEAHATAAAESLGLDLESLLEPAAEVVQAAVR